MAARAGWKPESPTAKAVWSAGFTYDPAQDIIVSRMDAPQRHLGYCWAYDVAAPTVAMVIDAEPVYFTYDGKQWMIELWKGQYGLETGCEIGVYNRAQRRLVPGNRGWFACVNDRDRLEMEFTLHRNGKALFTRPAERHWWLTGFRWGVFSEPEDLKMAASITLKDRAMCRAFRGALSTLGYRGVSVDNNTVKFNFAKPRTRQPVTRYGSPLPQKSNRELVRTYSAAKVAAGLTDNDPNTMTGEPFREILKKLTKWLGLWRT